MSQQAEARSWWADVEHLREDAERRHATAEDSMQARMERVHGGDRRTVQIGVFCCIVALTTAHP
jgi:hypothetical protein